MEPALKQEVRKEISRIVDLMIQAESIRESIAELKKDITGDFPKKKLSPVNKKDTDESYIKTRSKTEKNYKSISKED